MLTLQKKIKSKKLKTNKTNHFSFEKSYHDWTNAIQRSSSTSWKCCTNSHQGQQNIAGLASTEVIWLFQWHRKEMLLSLCCPSKVTLEHTSMLPAQLYCTAQPSWPRFLWRVKQKDQRRGGKRLPLHRLGCFFWFRRNWFCINGVILRLV